MIIGQARTGKTSLKKSLKGELFDPDEGRTEGIETDPSYFKVTTDVWRTASNSEDTETEAEFLLDRQVAQNIAKGIKEEERLGDPSTSKTKPSVKDFQEVEPSEANSPPTESSGESRSNRFEPSLQDFKEVENAKAPPLRTEPSVEPEELKTSSLVTEQRESDPSPQNSEDHQKVPENVAVWVEKLLKENKEFMEGDDMYSVIWDFGGQSVFYDTHPIFLTEKAIYILTCDLSCDPYQKADTPVKKAGTGKYRTTTAKKQTSTTLIFGCHQFILWLAIILTVRKLRRLKRYLQFSWLVRMLTSLTPPNVIPLKKSLELCEIKFMGLFSKTFLLWTTRSRAAMMSAKA